MLRCLPSTALLFRDLARVLTLEMGRLLLLLLLLPLLMLGRLLLLLLLLFLLLLQVVDTVC